MGRQTARANKAGSFFIVLYYNDSYDSSMICNSDRTFDNTDTNILHSPHVWPQYVDKGWFYVGWCTDNPDRASYHHQSSASEPTPRCFCIPLGNLHIIQNEVKQLDFYSIFVETFKMTSI